MWWALPAAVLLSMVPAAAQEPRGYDCVIDPSEVLKIGSPVTGILADVTIARGDKVTAGQPLAQLESGVERATLALNRAKAENRAEIDAATAKVDYALSRVNRAKELLDRKLVPQEKFEEITADLEVARQDLASKQLDRRLAELDAARSRADLDQRAIKSPIDGVITERKLGPGEFVNQDGYIVTVAKLDPLYVEVFLPVALYTKLELGMTGTVRPEAPIGGAYAATVAVVDRVFDPASNTFGVRLKLPNPGNKLPGGQRCKVSFDLPAIPASDVPPATGRSPLSRAAP
ncbi:efflux RND transporter periplasmic adaptor subunit [Aquabacter sp. CN5-332]|uniref:efflux RND transporter periplasmic adaptor subunit n=1 Tax=Aquabacter sp. CN5-332 TaxID=3156608 RepID=UPI0032B4DB92